MTAIQVIWSVIGAQWALMLIISGYFFKKQYDIEQSVAKIDKDTAVKLAAIETQLAGIHTTLLELKNELREAYHNN